MGTYQGVFTNSSEHYRVDITSNNIGSGTFKIVGDVIAQTGNNSRNFADVFNPIQSTQLRLTALDSSDLFDDLQGQSFGSIRITVTNTDAGTIAYKGYIQQSNIERNPSYNLKRFVLTATDGLSVLKQKVYDLQGTYNLAKYLSLLVGEVGIIDEIMYIARWQETNMPNDNPVNIRFDASYVKAETYYDALEFILRRFNLIISQSTRNGSQWVIAQRSAMGVNRSAWLIDSNGFVLGTKQSQTDSITYTNSDIDQEHLIGLFNAIEQASVSFEWNTASPFIKNSSFQQWSADGASLADWTLLTGSITQDQWVDGANLVKSTDIFTTIRQRLNFIKPAFEPLKFDFTISPESASTSNEEKLFTYAQIKFIDPLGFADDTYLTNTNGISTSPQFLQYAYTPNTSTANETIIEICELNSNNDAYNNNRIIELTLFFSLVDNSLQQWFNSVSFRRITSNLESVAIPDTKKTFYSSNALGDEYNQSFTISDNTPYNANGDIEVWDGSAWIRSSDWGSSQSLDATWVSDIGRQTNTSTNYYKLKLLPSAWDNADYSVARSYNFGLYIVLFQLKNYTNKTVDLQMVALRNYALSQLSQIYLSSGESIVTSTTPLPVFSLEIEEVTGDVEITYPKPKQGDNTLVMVTWSDIVVFKNNGESSVVEDGFRMFTIKNLPYIFYYDADENAIKNVERTVWLYSDFASKPTRYTKLFSIEKNEDVDGLEGSIVVPFAEEIAKTLFTRAEITDEANFRESIFDYKTNSIAILNQDIDGETNTLKVRDVRVTLPKGTRLSIISDVDEYTVITAVTSFLSDATLVIEPTYINALAGAIIKYHSSYNGAQLLIQPEKVKIIAESADSKATSSLELISQSNLAIAELNATVYGEDGTGLSAGLLLEVTNIKSRAVLQVDGGGRISVIELGSGETSTAKISADDILIEGTTTFYDRLTADIINGTLDVPVGARTISSDDPPAERPDGGILREGDIWFDTDDSGKPYRYNGTNWIPSYTTFDGGNITTGTIKAAQIDVDDLFAENIKVTGSLIAYRNNAIIDSYVKVNSEGLVAFYDGIKTFDIPTNGTPRFLNGEIENVIIKVYESTQTEIRTGDNVETDGGLIFDRFGIKAYDTTGTKTVDITRQGNAYFKGQLDANQGTLENLSVIGDITLAEGGQIIIGNNMLISQSGITGDNINIDSFQVSVNQPSGETYALSVNGIIGTNASGSRRVTIEDTGIFITRDSQVVSLTANATTGALESNKGFKGAHYTSSGVAGVTQTVSNPTSITVTQGIITAIS